MNSLQQPSQLPSPPEADGVLTTKKCNQSRNETRTKFSTVRVLWQQGPPFEGNSELEGGGMECAAATVGNPKEGAVEGTTKMLSANNVLHVKKQV